MLSRYTLVGRRRGGRRAGERHECYADRFPSWAWLLIGGLGLLSVVDWAWTVAHLQRGTPEANPLLAWTLQWGGLWAFAAVKLGVTAAVCAALLLHCRFRLAQRLLPVAVLCYVAVIGIHIGTEMATRGA